MKKEIMRVAKQQFWLNWGEFLLPLVMDSEQVRQLMESLECERRLRLEAESKTTNEKRLRLEAESKTINEKRLRLEAESKTKHEIKLRLEAESKLKLVKYLALKSLSNAQIFSNYTKLGTLTNCENLDLPQVNPENLIYAWNEIRSEIRMLADGTNEKTHVHPFIEFTLVSVIKNFNLRKIKYHYEPRLVNPRFSPDFGITSSHISDAAWADCLSFIECKSTEIPFSEGAGQAISYLTHLAIPDSLNVSEIRELSFSAITNGLKIQFFVFKKVGSVCKNYFTSELNLFKAVDDIRVPSIGFKILCRFMLMMEETSISVDSLRIDGNSYDVMKTFQKCGAMVVGLVDLGGEEGMCVAKYALNQNKFALSSIRKEANIYKMLENSPVKTLRLSTKSNFNHLVFLDVAKGDLRSWANNIIHADQEGDQNVEIDFENIIRCFIEIFDQIKALHDLGYTHGDIRPANILVLNDDTPRLIDFVTVTKKGEVLNWQQGTLLFMAEDVLRQNGPYIYKSKYDMESLFYSFLDCSDVHYSRSFLSSCINIDFDSNDANFNEQTFADSRKTRLADLKASKDPFHFKYPKFVDLFFELFDKLADIPGDLNEQDYHEFRQILESYLTN
jgi:serine/threonine protein kinase